MKTINLKIDDALLEETEKILGEIKLSRNRYFNAAIAHYNRRQKRSLLAEKLGKESKLVREESMRVLRDFENLS